MKNLKEKTNNKSPYEFQRHLEEKIWPAFL